MVADDDLQWKITLVEDNLQWKRTFNGRRSLVEYDLWWKMTFSRRQPSVEDHLWWKTTLVGSLHAAYSALRHFSLKVSYSIMHRDNLVCSVSFCLNGIEMHSKSFLPSFFLSVDSLQFCLMDVKIIFMMIIN